MSAEAALLESRTLRESVMGRIEVLDRVKALSLLPDGTHVTTAMLAAYFEVRVAVLHNLVTDHRGELEGNGYRVVTGPRLTAFKAVCGIQSRSRSVAVFERRTVLNVAMLLRDSEVARQVRAYLLNVEAESRSLAVDNLFRSDAESLDAQQVLPKPIALMFNLLIEATSEQRRELLGLREEIQRIGQRLMRLDLGLQRHELALQQRSLAGVMADIDALGWREFEQYVAELCIRDGCTNVRVIGGKDRGVDISGLTADGRRLIVQCKNFAPFRSVWSGEMQKFLGAAKVQHQAGAGLFVATCSFSAEALAIAKEYGVFAVDRGLLQAWAAGLPLRVLS